jgi:hypothetical protein
MMIFDEEIEQSTATSTRMAALSFVDDDLSGGKCGKNFSAFIGN